MFKLVAMIYVALNGQPIGEPMRAVHKAGVCEFGRLA